MGRILALDYGKKRVGIAVTDPLQITANGLDTGILRIFSSVTWKRKKLIVWW